MSEEKSTKEKKTALGLDENVEGLLCYSVGWITGIIFLLLEPKNDFIKFHAIQSIITFGALSIFTMIPIIGWMLSPLVGLLGLVLWILLMVKAFQGEMFKLPVVGDIAEKQVKK
ncbi:TPA: hypothetical protein DDW69_00100 [candidate division CPR2 bacterium]|uniref:DUF4870 domain-containing protein n=1 Tax=candidate division CPR2 bacterium GW2011_GWC1_41_48 TaxID=1618344 RepID=A0A0G0YGR5_UNCC2|nr:MAG: hypothetical protein UT47_C0005G0047 [candidate division CPR2 bacterium GW2011_GWC2_39_35]KKR28469.1 MAG: hypothetical protein UT60_C0019G0004 [candidate division CPR2 bacterium GW2011_GWD2_39_7]KKS08736.1 MAG: hypothetical protein UU65_C0005G0047 [candidate division CPR2 bacterium GW2011_GWC1_41_48]OGB72737.1 MAG: hypothetical protein A2Y26_04660 [candidate division CPR2 bacterium GWD2_39_7]HBG81227.1 hypothetical protein [candidate division CPR2 bacterium]